MGIEAEGLLVDILDYTMDLGIPVTMFKQDGKVMYDIDLRAKSHIHLTQEQNGDVYAYMRYDRVEKIEDFYDLFFCMPKCMHGRKYMNEKWVEVLDKMGFLSHRETMQKPSIY